MQIIGCQDSSCSSEVYQQELFRSLIIPSLAQSVKWQMERLRSSQETSSSTCPKLSGLESLSQCVDDLLRLPLTHQALSNEQFQELADEVLD
ncbi:hypothetical protein NC651_004840 [Populus alba x Populus x berolinensis]|nr:hypothetical protein NC651_004840 [Populus alba x Populus x berolinensis]